ncbi:serine/threonine-protein kinase [Microbacterium sp. YY-01]|uniref:serine/threonine-protein kinase n=1 Tax=Microbacterium sp. YY-01 TaxID=3421634 RepID=UPI003D16DF05
MSRPPSPPPELDGFTYLELLGTGGFADVFLYEQHMPRRKVAVKVLLADRLASAAAQEFTEEANVMAMLSTHPAIVTIYHAGVAADGRPYLVMEYCPRPNLQVRARNEPFNVAEALRVGIQVAGAVETAHRAGVLHRDIKPANILVTEYNRPALTDFGIASTTGAVSDATGMSIPWSPPESFADPPSSGPRSDVYALAATVYTLLTGRSPFERPGERNTSVDLIERIERSPLAPISRADAPASLQRVLEQAMAKKPEERYPSAVAFARALQKIQIELSHSVTSVDVVDDYVHETEPDDPDDGLTRVRNIAHIDPESGSTRPSAATRQMQHPAPTAPRFDAVTPAAASPAAGSATQPAVSAPSISTPSISTPSSADAVADTQVRAPQRPAPAVDDATVMRAPTVVHSTAAPTHASAATPGVGRVPDAGDVAAAGGVEHGAPRPEPSKKRRMLLWGALAIAGAALITVGAIFAVNQLNSAVPEAREDAVEVPRPQDVIVSGVPTVTELAHTIEGDTVVFTWENPNPEDGDSYLWYLVDLDGNGSTARSDEPTVSVSTSNGGPTCIEVILRRADGRSSDPVRECAS